ncbi:hypothetical protein [Flavobacterium sp.]|uniref:hypothetical protein n=1 Tax=Flavobacterium sp. TaxID=239 RepID=UPI002ED9564E
MALLCWGLGLACSYAQVGMPTNNPNKDAVLDLNRTDGVSAKGLLLPKVALTATNSFAPMTANVAGMHVWNTATAGTGINVVTPGEYYNDGSKWIRVSSATDAWIQDGNNNGAIKAIGTNDAFDLPVETNGVEKMRVTSGGQVLINTATSMTGGTTAKLQINNGTQNGALQIKDGSEGSGRVFTSDANGLGTWQDMPGTPGGFVLSAVTIAAGTRSIPSTTPAQYLGRQLTLTPGKWIIYYGELVQSSSMPVNGNVWLQLTLSESKTSRTNPNFSFLGTSLVSGNITYPNFYNMLAGVFVIQVTNTTTLYNVTWGSGLAGATLGNILFDTSFGENYLFATKIY